MSVWVSLLDSLRKQTEFSGFFRKIRLFSQAVCWIASQCYFDLPCQSNNSRTFPCLALRTSRDDKNGELEVRTNRSKLFESLKKSYSRFFYRQCLCCHCVCLIFVLLLEWNVTNTHTHKWRRNVDPASHVRGSESSTRYIFSLFSCLFVCPCEPVADCGELRLTKVQINLIVQATVNQ